MTQLVKHVKGILKCLSFREAGQTTKPVSPILSVQKKNRPELGHQHSTKQSAGYKASGIIIPAVPPIPSKYRNIELVWVVISPLMIQRH